jgi:tetratricopeptide (TPR) repeat protein
MTFLRKLFGNKPAPAQSKPVATAKPSSQLAFLQAKADEKLSLLRYLATCGHMDATKLEAYLSIFESYGNELGPEKKSYLLKTAPMMAPSVEGGRVLNGYERLRWSFIQTHMEEVNKVIGMVKELPAEPAHGELLARIVSERDKLQHDIQQAPTPEPPPQVDPAPPSGTDDAASHLTLGQAHKKRGDLKAAIDEYRKAVQLKPHYAEAHSALGAALCDAGDHDSGAQECREAIRLNPDDFAASYHLGNALYYKGDFSDAITHFRAAIRLKSDLLEARNNLANTFYTTGDLNAAITEFRELLKLAPTFPDAHNNLGNALYENGDIEGAIREYKEAIQLKPGSNIANVARENLERAATEAEFVRKCLEPQYREEREDRKWDSPGVKEVNTLLNSGKYEECARVAEAKAAESSDLDLYYDWGGSACLKMNDYDRARKIVLQGIAKGKRKNLNCNMMGEVEWKAGNAKEALYWWAQAVHCLESIKDHAEESPYLYLHYIADGVGLSSVAASLIDRVDQIRYSVRLNATSAANLSNLVRQQATPGMRCVLTILHERYLTPTPPTKEDLPEPEEKLYRALRKIESQLKDRPNPAFSMVSLSLEATPLGKKIVWCYRTRYEEPCAMDAVAAASFLNQELKPIGVSVSSAGYMGGRGGRGNQLFDYDLRTTD